MSKAKRWSPPGSGSRGPSYIHIDERKPCRLTPDEGPFEDNEDYPVGTHDSTEEMSVGTTVVATATAAHAGGPDFSLIDSPKENPNSGLFTVKTANQAIKDAKNRPPLRYLFGQLWCEGENCILFSDTNAGKTILAMQIADTISSGRRIVLGLTMDAQAQKVAYIDLELSEMQFRKRYSDVNGSDYQFSSNLLRVEINPDAECPDGYSFEDYLRASLERLVVDHGVKILVVDNITFFSNELEQAKGALPLMKWLKALGRKHGLSILILAHTPKRNMSNPITVNDLAGSKMLSNFADSIFAIGVSAKDSKMRYIKELKQRNEAYKYDADNVIVCEIEKPGDFLQFGFRGYGCESDHLTATQRDEEVRRAKELQSQGKTQREIAAQMGVSLGKVNNLLKP